MAHERILVVEDSHDNRLFVSKYILEPAGYQVLTARDGVDGLRLTLEEHPDLLLLDLQMPRMNGIEVVRSLQKEAIQIPIILMTFHGSEEIIINAFRMGVKDYIIKPFTPDEILASIEHALTEIRLRKERDALLDRLMVVNRRLERRLVELNALAGIGRSVTALMTSRQLLGRVLEGALYLLRGDEGVVILHDQQEQSYRAKVRIKALNGRAEPMNQQINDPIAQKVVESRQAITSTGDEGQLSLPTGTTATLYVPLLSGKKAIGAIGISSKHKGRKFTRNDLSLLGAVADYAAVALENTRLFGELEAAKEREKQEIRRMFQTYVAPSVVEQVMANPATLALGGVKRTVTVLFADIRGFSSLSEQVEPEQLVSVLNGYIAAMAHTLLEHEGTMDKILGDAVMAFFNAPIAQYDHPFRAARAALAIMTAIETHRQCAPIQLHIGIGFATGEAIVGHIGSTDLMNYTVIGDTVNLAKRLQEEARPGQILMSASTYRQLKERVTARPLGTVPLKGKAHTEALFELVGLT